MKRYDEASVVRHLLSIRKVTRIDTVNQVITINPDTPIGNRAWGKLDFLTNRCGYHIVKERGNKVVSSSDNDDKKKKEKKVIKKMREHNSNTNSSNSKNNGKNKIQSNNTKTSKTKKK